MTNFDMSEETMNALINLDPSVHHDIQVARDAANSANSIRQTIYMNSDQNPFRGKKLSDERKEQISTQNKNFFIKGNANSFTEGTVTNYDKHEIELEEQALLIKTVHKFCSPPSKRRVDWLWIATSTFPNKIFDLSKIKKTNVNGSLKTELTMRSQILKQQYDKYRTVLDGRDVHPQLRLLAETCSICNGAIRLKKKYTKKNRSETATPSTPLPPSTVTPLSSVATNVKPVLVHPFFLPKKNTKKKPSVKA